MNDSRRSFIKSLGLLSVGLGVSGSAFFSCSAKTSSNEINDSTNMGIAKPSGLFFKISLAEWSLHKMLQAGKMDHLDFPAKAKNEFGINAVEYVNQFFMDKASDQTYLSELKKRCDDNGVTSVLIMCDNEGFLANTDDKKRQEAVENHFKWVEAAQFLGCHSIRVNCFGEGEPEEVAQAGIDGLRRLSDFARPFEINVIVENHGSYSSNGQWLQNIMKEVSLPNCGTLPDFGNFCLRREKGDMWESPCVESYDRYKGVEEMMPFAKGVSAKAYDFDKHGNCIETDYSKMLSIVKAAGYNGYIGIEYEGDKLSEEEGIKVTKALLEKTARSV
jgi:sugar phosphate isomerase/epimerase